MKKVLSVVLVVLLMLSVLPTGLFSITVSAATASGRCGNTAYWTINTNTGRLDITGTGQIGPYGSRDAYGYYEGGPRTGNFWMVNSTYAYANSIKNVYINEGITGIASEVFYANWRNGYPTYIQNLESIHVPTTLEYIYSSAFYKYPDIYICDLASWCQVNCYDQFGDLYFNDELLSGELVIPNNVAEIGTGVFYSQDGITSVTIPEGVTSIGNSAFSSCTNLKTATVSGNCPITSDCGLGNITTLTIRGDVDTVSGSFNNLKKVQQIAIENGVETIDSDAFNGCSKLTQVSLTNSVKEIGANAFNGCDALTDVYFDGTILEWINITKGNGNAALNSATVHYSEIADIADATPNVSNVTYNSEELCPTVTINGLTENVDFTVEYSNNINVGTANAVIKGINTCSGEKSIPFDILPADISNAAVTGITDKIFTNNEITQNILVEMFDDVLTENIDYTVNYSNNTNVGEATITINGIGNFCSTWNNSFNIGCKDISSAVVENIEDKTFDYQYFTQENISVTVGNILLIEDKDYTVSYKSNYNAGTASVIITGKGNYAGTVTKYFRINSRDINETSISGILYSKDYDTSAQTQNPTLTFKGYTLTSSDFKISYINNTNCGIATMTITGKNNFTGSFTIDFEIEQADISDCTISGITNKDYTGSAITQKSISVYINGKRLVENTHYTVEYTNNIEAGKAQVIIKGIGNLKGKITKEFSIKKTHPHAGIPTLVKVTINSIEVEYFEGMEYRLDNGEWQSSPIFNNLVEGTSYTIWQRWAETDLYKVNSSIAGLKVVAEHTYDNDCDPDCNVCGFTRTELTHTYKNDCDPDCNICGFVRSVPDHIYTDDCDGDCNVCGFVITPKHYYNFDCSTSCSRCHYNRQAAKHTYDNLCDTDCNVCSEMRTISHTYETKNIWAFDKTGHWEKCYICNNETSMQAHIFSGDTDTTCDTCGYTRFLESVSSQAHLTTVPKGYKGIYNYSDLLGINSNPSGKYILMADIDVSQHNNSVIVNKEFTGVFNGNGYAIKNFTYDTEINKEIVLAVGIFIKNKGIICNLTIRNFSSVISLKNKKASAFIGLIVADNMGTIRNCSILDSTAFCSGNDVITLGGVAASNTKGVIEYCKVTSSNYERFLGSDTNSSSSTSGSVLYSGGICGYNEGTIRACYTSLYVTVGSGDVSMLGGISAVNEGNIVDCYSSGTMMFDLSTTSFGCVVGYNHENGYIKNTFSNGYCTQANNSNYRVRCIARKSFGTIQNSYVKSDYLASAICQYGTHCTNTQFSQLSTFAGFDFNTVWSMGSSAPYLKTYSASTCIEGNAHSGGLNHCCTAKICDICGEVYGEYGDHSYSQWTTAYESTCTYKGMKVRTCLYCGHEECEEIAKKSHTYPKDESNCEVCGQERPPYTPGDIDGVEGVTDRDAVHLLYHTFLPDLYPVNQDCDFNNDGYVNDKDAVYLLYHTFLPDLYPIN